MKKLNKFAVWTYGSFLVLITILFFVMWVLEAIFESLMPVFARNSLVNLTEEIRNEYNESNSKENIDQIAIKNGINVYIFTINKNENDEYISDDAYINYEMIIYSERDTSLNSISTAMKSFIDLMIKSDTESQIYSNDSMYNFSVTISGFRQISDQTMTIYYLAMSETITNSISDLLFRMLWIITLVMLVVSIALAFLLTRRLTNPLDALNKTAIELSLGNMDVEFPENHGYQEIKTLSNTLNIAKQEIQKASRLEQDYIANVTHDLKTPITIIKSYAELIKDISGDNKDARNEHLDIILDETTRLTKLVDDILVLSKVQADKISTDNKALCIKDIAMDILTKYQPEIEKKNIIVNTTELDDTQIFASESEIRIVLENFITNALHYTKSFLKVGIENHFGKCTISVSDNGIGISESDMEHIFDRYFRSSENYKRKIEGSGLGLAICKAILDKYGFKYGAESKPGLKTKFFFTAPIYKEN